MKHKRKKNIFTKLLFGISIPVVFIFILSGVFISGQAGKSMQAQSIQTLDSASPCGSKPGEFIPDFLFG